MRCSRLDMAEAIVTMLGAVHEASAQISCQVMCFFISQIPAHAIK